MKMQMKGSFKLRSWTSILRVMVVQVYTESRILDVVDNSINKGGGL